MVGQLDQPAGRRRTTGRRRGLDRAGVGAVEDAPLGGQQLVVGGFLDQRVAEPVSRDVVVEADDEKLRIDGLVKGQPHLGLGQPAHLGEDLVIDLAAGDGGDLDEAAGALRGGRQVDQQDAAQRLGEALATLAGLVDRGDQLLGEERVAV